MATIKEKARLAFHESLNSEKIKEAISFIENKIITAAKNAHNSHTINENFIKSNLNLNDRQLDKVIQYVPAKYIFSGWD